MEPIKHAFVFFTFCVAVQHGSMAAWHSLLAKPAMRGQLESGDLHIARCAHKGMLEDKVS